MDSSNYQRADQVDDIWICYCFGENGKLGGDDSKHSDMQ